MIPYSDNIFVEANKPADPKYGAYASVSAANTAIIPAYRHKGLTVGIIVAGEVVEYWYKAGTTDGDLVPKSSGGGHTIKDATTTFTQRATMKFTGNVAVSDNGTETVVNVPAPDLTGYATTSALDGVNTTATNAATAAATAQTTANGKADATHTHANATTSAAGFMSATDKATLDNARPVTVRPAPTYSGTTLLLRFDAPRDYGSFESPLTNTEVTNFQKDSATTGKPGTEIVVWHKCTSGVKPTFTGTMQCVGGTYVNTVNTINMLIFRYSTDGTICYTFSQQLV